LRQDINSSKRKGVSIDCTVADGDELRFCEIMSGLENVKNSIIHSNAYYQMVYRENLASGGLLVKARYQDKTIAIMTVAFVGERCWAVYMANDYEYRNLAPNKVLMWEGIRIALSRSCRFFDMGATQGKSFDPEDPLDRYKLGFVPEIVEFPGYFDYPFSPVLYQLFKFLEFKLVPFAHYLKRRIGILVKKKMNIITKADTAKKASSI
jgi:lipid II:glycine glycyltransferase (peptidoglycan interpeptide bridge formation enzyme)